MNSISLFWLLACPWYIEGAPECFQFFFHSVFASYSIFYHNILLLLELKVNICYLNINSLMLKVLLDIIESGDGFY